MRKRKVAGKGKRALVLVVVGVRGVKVSLSDT